MSSGTDNLATPQNDEERAFASVFRTGLSENQVKFLEAYLCWGSVNRAAKESGVARSQHYEWVVRSAKYLACFEEAQRQTNVAIENEIRRRAMEGILVPVYGKEGFLGHKRQFSDTLLLRLAEANDPERWKVAEKKPDQNQVKFEVYMPDNQRAPRVPVEGEPETIPLNPPAEPSVDAEK